MFRDCSPCGDSSDMTTTDGTGLPDWYEILQVRATAEPEVISGAFRALARKHHPDVGGCHERMTMINEAWAVLGSPERRADYDRGLASRPPARSAPSSGTGHEGPIARRRKGEDSSRIVDFGRYAGWSLLAVAERDREYLEWLQRSPAGRSLRDEIEAALRSRQP